MTSILARPFRYAEVMGSAAETLSRVGFSLELLMMACTGARSKDAASDAGDASPSSSAGRSDKKHSGSDADRVGSSDVRADASFFDGSTGHDAADGGGDTALAGSAGGTPDAGGASGGGGMSNASLGAGGGDCGKCPPLTMNQAAFFGASCCTNPGNECGVSFLDADCIPFDQPGVLDPACPSEVIALLLTVTLPGCCRPEGQCGVMEPADLGLNLNVGCVRRDTKVLPQNVRRDLIPCTP